MPGINCSDLPLIAAGEHIPGSPCFFGKSRGQVQPLLAVHQQYSLAVFKYYIRV
ncbi:hypothetical protein [Desulfofarcimen acetoxidans]|uniref:hypothetical protein n=1 Tax=Desulfofarcimen acetoxidans TaxID=58138 RepID=UPI0002D86CA3|nr:hypothetical protein [Desulfofarcimen acetoxidans]